MKKTKTLPIVVSPDPTLRTVCDPCEIGDPALRRLGDQMLATMYVNSGCGLAAPQVGITKRIIVVDCSDPEADPEPIILVNPEIVETSGDVIRDLEGCLSCPGISVPIRRPEVARVRYYDLDGVECEIESGGLLGRCLQHEIDHLNGITLFEACSPIDRLKALHDYRAAQEAGARPGETATVR